MGCGVTERPILFSGPMVRAILDGRKTQTRRIAKIPGADADRFTAGIVDVTPFIGRDGPTHEFGLHSSPHVISSHVRCPCGSPGDRLWVRETWSPWSDVVDCGEDAKLRDARAQMPWACILYGADRAWTKQNPADNGGRWRPSIHMPRWASRLTLDVTAVRVQRLQAISEADAIAEGVRELPLQEGQPGAWWTADPSAGAALHARDPVAAFRKLWDSINGDRASWESNPWVWVVEFTRAEVRK